MKWSSQLTLPPSLTSLIDDKNRKSLSISNIILLTFRSFIWLHTLHFTLMKAETLTPYFVAFLWGSTFERFLPSSKLPPQHSINFTLVFYSGVLPDKFSGQNAFLQERVNHM